MTSDREQELWLMIIGAALASKEARERIFLSLQHTDAPSPELRNLLRCLQNNDHSKIEEAFEGVGHTVTANTSIIGQFVDQLREHLFHTKMKKKMFMLSHSTGITKEHMAETLKNLLDDLGGVEDDSPEGN